MHPTPVLTLVVVLTAARFRAAAGPRVDVNPDTDQADIRTPGWDNWRVPDGPSATAKFGGLTLSLRAASDGARLSGGWWKPGFDHTATMASDGVTTADRLELLIRGLAPGRHSLGTYPDVFANANPGRITVAGPGGPAEAPKARGPGPSTACRWRSLGSRFGPPD